MNPNKQIINENPTDNLVNINTIPVNKDYLKAMKDHNLYLDLIEEYQTALFLLKQAADIIDTLDNLELYSEEWLNIVQFLNQSKVDEGKI